MSLVPYSTTNPPDTCRRDWIVRFTRLYRLPRTDPPPRPQKVGSMLNVSDRNSDKPVTVTAVPHVASGADARVGRRNRNQLDPAGLPLPPPLLRLSVFSATDQIAFGHARTCGSGVGTLGVGPRRPDQVVIVVLGQ